MSMNPKPIMKNYSVTGRISKMDFAMRNVTFNTPNGKQTVTRPVANFDVAVNGDDGSTVYFKSAKWGADARIIHEHFSIGDTVRVDGDLYENTREYNGNTYVDNVLGGDVFVQMIEKRQSRVGF